MKMVVVEYAIASFCIIIVSLIIYVKWSFTFWSRRNVFRIKPVFPFGNANGVLFRRKTLSQTLTEVYKEAKSRGLKYAGFYFITKPFLVLVDLGLVKKIFSNDFQHFTDHTTDIETEIDPLAESLFNLKGAKWKALRSKLTPLFSSGKLKAMMQTLVDCTKGFKNYLDENAGKQEPIDIKETFALYTIDIIGSVAFGIETNCFKNPQNDFRKYGKRILDPEGAFQSTIFLMGFFFPRLLRFLRIPDTEKDIETFFMNTIKQTIDYRDKNNIERKDFMQLLLKLRHEEIVTENSNDVLVYYQNGLTLNEIAAQALAFFTAGFETSSTTLSFLMYELTQNPEIQEKLIEEISQVLEGHDGQLTYEAVQKMTYLDQCVNEALRKHPPVVVLARECTKTYKIPDSNLVIEKGEAILIPTIAIQRDPELYPDPEKFDPERFSEENKQKILPFSYLPFGEGPRLCIGQRFGLLQVKVGLVALLQDYKFTLNPKTKTPLQFTPTQLLNNVEGGIWVDVHKHSK